MRDPGPIPTFDLYRELEVDPTASGETIAAAYRSLARRFHPDAGSPADERMRRLNLAHEWLMDPVRRARYDGASRVRREHIRAAAPTQAPAVEPAVQIESATRTVTFPRLARYFTICLVGVIGAYVLSVVIAVLASSTSLPVIVGIIVGEETALQLLNLVGNIAYAATLGYVAANASLDLIPTGGRRVPRPLWVIGSLAAASFTFGFPAFGVSYLGGLADWMATAPAIAAVAVTGVIQGLFVGVVVLAVALVQRGRWGAEEMQHGTA